jgi:hypothetical protein
VAPWVPLPVPLLSVNTWRSTKITVVSYRWLLTDLCRASPFTERLTLGKEVFAECLSMSSVLLSVNVVVTESVTLPSAVLGKEFFVEYPTKNTQQNAEHSAKSWIPVVFAYIQGFYLCYFRSKNMGACTMLHLNYCNTL